jgi:hypothetical protein
VSNLSMMVKSAALVMLGLAAAGCGGPEEAAAEGKPALQAPNRAALVTPRLDVVPPVKGEKSAQVYDPSRHEVIYVCVRINGTDSCEDVSGWDDTANDWSGTVGVWTVETYGNGSYFASFNSSSVSWDQTQPIFSGGVLVGMWRHYTLSSVTSGDFFSQIQGTNSVYYSDQVHIY